MKPLRAAESSAAGFAVAIVFTPHRHAFSAAPLTRTVSTLGALSLVAVENLRSNNHTAVRMQNFPGAT
jgi:hypothetical protein